MLSDRRLHRIRDTVSAKSYGVIALEVADENGKVVPARVGVYDRTGRLPLPGDEAIAWRRFNDVVRIVTLNKDVVPWPHTNPSAFYIKGSYHAKLPEGEYELIVAKGPEYRISKQVIHLAGNETSSVKVKLQRWDNLPAKGWISGDNHIHYTRESARDDDVLLVLAAAEDLHVANILQAGHAGGIFFPQYDWQPVSSEKYSTYAVVPGQEDPRTSRRGHTISLNLRNPVRLPGEYFLYHTVLEQARAQGGVTGYAHVLGKDGYSGVRVGLALDVPHGLVDFAEVMQAGLWGTDMWFDFLNLGYKLSPAAGTDYPYLNIPGAERNYVRVRRPIVAQAWFDGWKRGAVFASNGPMLEFSVNGQEMGSELYLQTGEKLTFNAKATINPDIDTLDRLELVEHGEIVKSVHAESQHETILQLTHESKPRHGSWFIVRVFGRKQRTSPVLVSIFRNGANKAAFSAPVYVHVDGQGFWKPAEVPSIVARLKQGMTWLMSSNGGPETCTTEVWGAGEACLRNWNVTKDALQERVNKVTAIYDDLVSRARLERGF